MGGSVSLIRLLLHVLPFIRGAQRGQLWAACELTLTARQTTAWTPGCSPKPQVIRLLWNLLSRSSQGERPSLPSLTATCRRRLQHRGAEDGACKEPQEKPMPAFSAPLLGPSLRPFGGALLLTNRGTALDAVR
jgi:hypothetical protein